jgi:NADPH-dependent 2,4-dienoyl-CoA reductase/sulfur reductase-like enzyme
MLTYSYVILGGGMVAGYAAKELVERGIGRGELAIISSDVVPPYERPPLSKGFLAGTEAEESVYINPRSFYDDHGIELSLTTVVTGIDRQRKRLRTHAGGQIEFEKLLIATGAQVRTLDLPGAGLPGIYYLRSLEDAKQIKLASRAAQNAVVIGAGFIGMEVASVLAQKGLHTTMAFPGERVWDRFFTPPISAFFQQYYEQRGVSFASGESVTSFEGDGRLTGVGFKSGKQLPADLVVAGVGVKPATAVLEGVVSLSDGVVVNEFLESSVAGIYAAGDVANYRDVLFGKQRRVEHWDNAVEQGKHVARVMLGEREPFVHVPYFFSDVFDLSYEFWGDSEGAEEVVYRGDVVTRSFSAWWLQEGRVIAAFVMNRPDEERELAPRLIQERRPLPG